MTTITERRRGKRPAGQAGEPPRRRNQPPGEGGRGGDGSNAGQRSPRELIVIARPGAQLRATAEGGLRSLRGHDTQPLAQLLASQGAMIQPLFGASEPRLQAAVRSLNRSADGDVPDLSLFYHVDVPEAQMEDLAAQLRAHPAVEAAYVKPPGEPPLLREATEQINAMQPRLEDAPPSTPDFSARQIYLNAAPEGVDARYAWTLPGGTGAGVNIMDLEWSWRFTHEDLAQNMGGLVAGTSAGSDNHGTAVMGEIGADSNGVGCVGICPDAVVSTVAFSMPSATAIRTAADRLRPGDIMLLEIHRPGPGASGSGQDGYIAIEWWPDDFAAIRYAVSKGIIVVEAAGNGSRNLDDPIYDTPAAGFPSDWTNPFNRANRDSGAILVGAGAPPPNTHGRSWGADRSRLDFSNYGASIDAQGWGREVTSTGYGDLQGGADANFWYTDTFSGTSSASPIVVGVLGCVQGVLRAHSRVPLTPARARELLRSTGSPQQDEPSRPSSQRIGNRPDLRALINSAMQTSSWTGVQFTGTVGAGQTERWFTWGWPAHWHVLWTVVPTTPGPGAPQIKWRVQVERASDSQITYWLNVTNLSGAPVNVEARYAVLGW
jgi:hypothetical protein